jgi:periplasmic copper chaperone A
MEKIMTKRAIPLISVLCLAWLALLSAAQADDSSIRVAEAWARATPGAAKTGAVYLSITNTGATPDRLVAISTPAADHAEPHSMKMANGVMEMRPLGPIAIAPGGSIVFAPNGDHIMLLGLKAPLKEGATVALTLTFEHAGNRDVTAAVEKVGAMRYDPSGSGAASTMPGMSGMSGMH